LNIDYLTK